MLIKGLVFYSHPHCHHLTPYPTSVRETLAITGTVLPFSSLVGPGEQCNPPCIVFTHHSLWYVNMTACKWVCVFVRLCQYVQMCLCVSKSKRGSVCLSLYNIWECACVSVFVCVQLANPWQCVGTWMSNTYLWCLLVQWYCMFVISEAGFN